MTYQLTVVDGRHGFQRRLSLTLRAYLASEYASDVQQRFLSVVQQVDRSVESSRRLGLDSPHNPAVESLGKSVRRHTRYLEVDGGTSLGATTRTN